MISRATDLEIDFGFLAARLPFAVVRHLIAMGVPPAFIAALTGKGDLARARVALGRHGLFSWEGDEIALLLAVRDQGPVVDVCAMRSAVPNEWHLLTSAGWLLGEEWLLAAQVGTVSALRIFGNPFDWLRGGGAGICLLDWSRPSVSALRCLGGGVTLLCDDERAAQRLRSMLAWDGLPVVQFHKKRDAA